MAAKITECNLAKDDLVDINKTVGIETAVKMRDDARKTHQLDPDFRCPKCKQKVRPHRGSKSHPAHFEHLKRNSACPISHRARP
jgi:competence CoiA-like predicted nuclease